MPFAFLSVLIINTFAIGAKTDRVTLVDGTETDCEVLFVHPNAPCLVVRSARNSTVQSIPTAIVQKVTTGGKAKTYSPARKLSVEEQKTLELNGLWGDDASDGQIGQHLKQSWDVKPLIVWANPGKSGNGMRKESWLDERGQPLAADPFVEMPAEKKVGVTTIIYLLDGDVLLPEAPERYEVLQPGDRDYLGMAGMRHLTIEKNAHYQIRYDVSGNFWLKDGGEIGKNTQTGCFGSRDANRDTFVRFCGKRWPDEKQMRRRDYSAKYDEGSGLSHWCHFNAGDKGSIEIIGRSKGAGDRLTVERGTLIVSENSYIGNGPRGSFFSKVGTTVILLDGANIGWRSRYSAGNTALIGIGGTLMVGTPEHPLKKDFYFQGPLTDLAALESKIAPNQRTKGTTFLIGDTGSMAVHSSDPTKARVIFAPFPEDMPQAEYTGPKKGDPPYEGVTAVFLGKTDFDGVVFDGFYKGSIIVSEAARKQWKNVSFGEKNLGKPDELFRAP